MDSARAPRTEVVVMGWGFGLLYSASSRQQMQMGDFLKYGFLSCQTIDQSGKVWPFRGQSGEKLLHFSALNGHSGVASLSPF